MVMSANDGGIEGIIHPDDITVLVFLSEDLCRVEMRRYRRIPL
jgi:hypothetical protein